MNVLGLIPARGGSKGVPGKNIKLLGNKPLLAYTAEAAAVSSLRKTILSTDDQAIADWGKKLGLDVPFLRPAELAVDTTPTLPVIIHALRYLEEMGERYDAVCLLQATSPFRAPGLIDDCIARFTETNADTLITVQKVPAEYNPHWVFEYDAEGNFGISTGDEKIIERRQELPDTWHRDGQIYIVRTDILLNNNSMWGKNIVGFHNQHSATVNIDTLADWEKAELYVKNNF